MAERMDIRVPDIGDFEDVPVIEVLVSEGDTVEAEQSLVTLESDKATMEVPAPAGGVIVSLAVALNDTVSEGDLVGVLETGEAGEDDAGEDDGTTAPEAAESAAGDDSGAGPDTDESAEAESAAQEKDRASGEADPEDSEADTDGDSTSAEDTATTPPPGAGERRSPPVPLDSGRVMPDKVPYASPGIRAFARELGVDLLKVSGSGRKGRILREDVTEFVKSSLAGGGAPAAAPGAGATTGGGLEVAPPPKVDFAKFGDTETVALSRIKRISGKNLHRNWVTIPHVTHDDLADSTEMERFRQANKAKAKEQGFNLTPLAFIMKSVVATLRSFPNFNASLDPAGENLVVKKYYHLGIAVDTPDGLVVPVIRDVDKKSVLGLAEELAEVSQRARDGKLKPADWQGASFSISSLGGIGGTRFTPIINAPEVAILGVSRAKTEPVWDGEVFRPRLMLPLSLSYDHRVIDGAQAAGFCRALAEHIENADNLCL